MTKDDYNKIKLLKKANFHIHLTGSLTLVELRYLSKVTGIDISDYGPLENHFNFHDPIIWTVAKRLTSNEVGLIEVAGTP